MTSVSEQGMPPPANGAAHHETVLEVGTERIARIYAEALLRAAAKKDQADEILEELQALLDKVFKADPQFEAFLASGAVDRKRKAAVLDAVFAGRASDLLLNFLLVLNDHERLDVLHPIVAAYQELLNERAGRIKVQVRSAVPLPDDQKERLREQLRTALHKEPLLETETDPDLLGGLVVRVGDWLYDESVQAQLENIRNQIIARSSYEIQSGRNRFSTAIGN